MHRVWRALPWVIAAATCALAAYACRGDGVPDGDDVLACFLALAAIVWVIADTYYHRLTRDRQKAHAGHDVGVLAEGVAAYARQLQDNGDAASDPPR